MASIFTKIIQGDLPSYQIDEDEWSLSFLNINPIHLGHTLVVPKIEVDNYADVPDPYYLKVFEHVKKITKAIHQSTGCLRVGLMVQGLEVPHWHVHLVPMFGASDLNFSKAKPATTESLEEMQKKILTYL